ncbi:hypothetical protein PGT21_011224 [Puccinia graminis f. sp. tritici]|uniref:Uncharacterized protein n=1 Tax=Puccinia graminis f. sp. tritici TaxID=56615 RepID=A0A5B0LZI0_PUCGR|nr:hypothetical protein PGT21_011224 [Puccinia graminis f. sp. tritici]
MAYVISFRDESPGTCSGKVKGRQLKRKGKRSKSGGMNRGGQSAGFVSADYCKKL